MKRLSFAIFLVVCLSLPVLAISQDRTEMERDRLERQIQQRKKQENDAFLRKGASQETGSPSTQRLRERQEQLDSNPDQYFYDKAERDNAAANRPVRLGIDPEGRVVPVIPLRNR
jgi:hypothetical protein